MGILTPFLPLIKFVHLLFAFFWVGGLAFLVMFVNPPLRRGDAATQRALVGIVAPRLARFVPQAGLLTILFGYFTLLAMGRLDGVYLLARWGLLVIAGFALSLVMLFVSWRYTVPGYRRLAETLSSAEPDATEVRRLTALVRGSALATLVLGVVALLLMTLAGLSA
ncbi:MAG: hypothetical protein ACT4PT_13090 [Methanobacteriota archaeon]